MVSFDCPLCRKRIENGVVHDGRTACPFCLQIVAAPTIEPDFAQHIAEHEVPTAEKILEADIVAQPVMDLDSTEIIEPSEVRHWQDDDPTVEEMFEEFAPTKPLVTVDQNEILAAEERIRRRRARRAVIGWFALIFNLCALAGFTVGAILFWEAFPVGSYICISGASSTFFFLAVQFWPRRRRQRVETSPENKAL